MKQYFKEFLPIAAGSYDFVKSKEFQDKQKNISIKRLQMARKWLLVCLSYYVIRLIFVVYPRFFQGDDPRILVEIIQSVLCFINITGITVTYYKQDRYLYGVKYLIISFSVMMIISNFHQYHSLDEDDDHSIGFLNFQALNMLTSTFSIMFTIFNAIILSFIEENNVKKSLLISIIYIF